MSQDSLPDTGVRPQSPWHVWCGPQPLSLSPGRGGGNENGEPMPLRKWKRPLTQLEDTPPPPTADSTFGCPEGGGEKLPGGTTKSGMRAPQGSGFSDGDPSRTRGMNSQKTDMGPLQKKGVDRKKGGTGKEKKERNTHGRKSSPYTRRGEFQLGDTVKTGKQLRRAQARTGCPLPPRFPPGSAQQRMGALLPHSTEHPCLQAPTRNTAGSPARAPTVLGFG